MADEDTAVLQQIALGDTSAMRLLYERHCGALKAFLLTRSRDTGAVDDILHDTMLDVWRQADRYRGQASVRTWIFAIARNKQVDWMKKNARLSLVEEVPETPDDAPPVEVAMEAAQSAAQVRSCLSKLKRAQRTVIRLSFFEGMGYDEIAQIEGVPTGTVKSRIFHAKQALMHCLSQA